MQISGMFDTGELTTQNIPLQTGYSKTREYPPCY